MKFSLAQTTSIEVYHNGEVMKIEFKLIKIYRNYLVRVSKYDKINIFDK